jgi:hypothetical protein
MPATLSLDLAVAASVYTAFLSRPQSISMPPALSPSQLELLRHCFQYNDSSTFYRAKLSVTDIQDLVQQEPGEFRRRGRQDGEPGPSTSVTPMPQIIMMPPQPYLLPPLAPQQYLPPPAQAGRQSSPPGPEDPAHLHSYISWFKLREPLLVDTIEECLVVLSQEKDTLSTLERISEARIARYGLLAGLMTRLKDSVKTWRRAAS